jgi:two-component system, LytTR family, response regulator
MQVRRVEVHAAIIHGRKLPRRNLRKLLEGEGVRVVAEYERASHAVAGLAAAPAELLVVSAELPRNGAVALMDRLARRPLAIFTAGDPARARDAFDAGALDYLIEPVDQERLRQALARVRAALTNAPDLIVARQLAAAAAEAQPVFLRQIAVKQRRTVIFIRTADVDWFQSAANYIELHTGRTMYVIREVFSRLEEQLDPTQFARISRSAIVNIDRVTRLAPGIVELRDGIRLPLLAKYRRRLEKMAAVR